MKLNYADHFVISLINNSGTDIPRFKWSVNDFPAYEDILSKLRFFAKFHGISLGWLERNALVSVEYSRSGILMPEDTMSLQFSRRSMAA
ncbi:MAG: hypothetical protein V2A54_12885 [Bacteroidota bacterium]